MLHTIYASSMTNPLFRENRERFFIGRYMGDTYADDDFKRKMDKVTALLSKKYGFGKFSWYCSPGVVKKVNRLTNEQKYKRMASMAYNKHKKKVLQIINDNTLFVDDFLAEQQMKLHKRIDQLKKRYNV